MVDPPLEQKVTLRAVARHAAPCVIEGTVVPLAVFTVLVHTLGLHIAILGCLTWSYSALLRRVVGGRRVPGVLILGAVGVTFRLFTMLWTGSAFLYFGQPVLATVGTAAAFAVTAFVGRPLAARIGADFVPLPQEAWKDPEVRQVCSHLSLAWAAALAANAGLTLWLLSTLPVATFVLVRPVVPLVTTVPAILASILAGKAVMRRSGARLVPIPAPIGSLATLVAVAPGSSVAAPAVACSSVALAGVALASVA